MSQLAKGIRRQRVLYAAVRMPALALKALRIPVPESVYRHLWGVGEFVVTAPGGATIHLYAHGDRIENSLFWGGLYGFEGECVDPWMELAKRSRVIFDIGANTGFYALLGAAVSSGADVHAFEPVPRVAQLLLRNCSLNPALRVQVHECAVGAESGTSILYDPGGNNCYSASLDPTFRPGASDRYAVQVVAVDRVVEDLGLASLDLVKLDVEGYEEQALRGMRNTLERLRPAMLLEVLPAKAESLRPYIGALLGRNYLAFNPLRRGVIAPASESWADRQGSRNLLLIPVERMTEGLRRLIRAETGRNRSS